MPERVYAAATYTLEGKIILPKAGARVMIESVS